MFCKHCAKSLAAEVDVCSRFKHTQRCSSMFLQKAAEQMKSQKHKSLGWGGRLLAFHWALASHVVRVAVVHLQFPPWLREGVHCGRGGQWRAMVCLYMHLKVGRGGETWDQRNKEQGICLTHSGPWLWRGRPVTQRQGIGCRWNNRCHDCFEQNNSGSLMINSREVKLISISMNLISQQWRASLYYGQEIKI